MVMGDWTLSMVGEMDFGVIFERCEWSTMEGMVRSDNLDSRPRVRLNEHSQSSIFDTSYQQLTQKHLFSVDTRDVPSM